MIPPLQEVLPPRKRPHRPYRRPASRPYKNPDDPRIGRPCPHQPGPYPEGTVRVRYRRGPQRGDRRGRRRRGHRCRVIKHRGRWVNYARFLWERAHGPVPPGKVVLHLDGDTMNDALSNLAVGTPGDRIGLWHIRNPRLSEAQMRRLHEACGRWNRLQGEIRRLTSWLPTRWYPVDVAGRRVLNVPSKTKGRALAQAGFPPRDRTSGAVLAAVMGFPSRAAGDASVLAALVAGPACGLSPLRRLLEEVNRRRAAAGWSALTPSGLHQALAPLRAAGLLISFRATRGRGARYVATPAAYAEHLPCPYTLVLGRDLSLPPYAGFTRCHADGRPVGREERPPSALRALLTKEST